MVTPVLRVVASVGVLVGSSWLAVDWLDKRLTTRIIASTDEAMRDPTVQQEVDALLTRTAHRLLADPETEGKIAEFLTAVATEAEVQEGSLHILAGTLLSDQFKKAGVEVMKELSLLVLTDSTMREKLAGLSHGIATSLSEADKLHQLSVSVRTTVPKAVRAQEYAHSQADFSPALKLVRDRVARDRVVDEMGALAVHVVIPPLSVGDVFTVGAPPQFQL